MNQRGRPLVSSDIQCRHQCRIQKPQIVKEYWTQHRITLIAYEAQYVYSKKPSNLGSIEGDGDDKKNKKNKKKLNLQFESGFLSISPSENLEIDVEQLTKDYTYLSWLFFETSQEDYLEVREFVKIMLQLKHSCITKQFCEIYNLIVQNLKLIEFPMVEKEGSRFKLFQDMRDKILAYILEHKEKFRLFDQYLKNDERQTQKLLLVEIYCMVAERFKFNINQFYSEAFSITMETKPCKKIKRQ